MKKRLFAVLLAAALLLSAFPAQALAAGLAYGNVPIYTGYADIDYMADEILKGIPTAGKSDTEKIRAVYDWIVKNCSRYDWNGTYYFDTEVVLAQAQGAYGEKLSAALESGGMLSQEEMPGARKTLRAAALTYVAALAVSIAQLLRLLLLFGGRRDD